ncbi:type IV pilus modification PilV family protein [Deinococcus sp.]|uniref:type IV pilus modification PilV family protein n=1 Tax=Deinococcus sp. TaxID=47478 RepID=UPI003C7BF68A
MRRPINFKRPSDYRQQGFTIIEVLVAVALFAIVVLVVLVPITGLFGLTKRSTTQVGATNLAQQWLEQVKGQWLSQPIYNRACISTAPPASVTISLQDKNTLGVNVGTPYTVVVNPNCASVAAQTNPAPLRLVTVTATATNGTSSVPSTLSVEVAR